MGTNKGNQSKLPIPDNKNPKLICFQFLIPDDPQYRQALIGKITTLANWQNYDRNDGHDGRLVANVWKRVIASMAMCDTPIECPPCNENCENCDDCEDCDDCEEC